MPECQVETLVASGAWRRGRILQVVIDWLVDVPTDEHPDVRAARLRTLPDSWLLYSMGVGWSVGAAALTIAFDPAPWTVVWFCLCVVTQGARGRFTKRYLAAVDSDQRAPDQCLVFVTFLSLLVMAPGIGLLVLSSEAVLVSLGIVLTLGWMSYTASLLSGFPRLSLVLLYVLAWSMAGGLMISSTLWPIGVMGAIFPFAFQLMMRQNHIVITDALRAEHENRRLSMLDSLTGLRNRLGLEAWFRSDDVGSDERTAASSTAALLCLDLDGFKAVNDTYGHGAGDEVLRQVGERIRAAMSPTDLACRLGGDEFVVLVHTDDVQAAVGVAERLISACSVPYALQAGSSVCVGVSVGISMLVDPSMSFDAALAPADRAMYVSKAEGKGSWTLADGGATSLPQASDHRTSTAVSTG